MKNKRRDSVVLVIACLAACAASAYAEVLTDYVVATNYVKQEQSGYTNSFMSPVGIGTASPDTDYKLDVNGAVKTKGVSLNGYYLSGDGDNEGVHVSNDGTVWFSDNVALGVFDYVSGDGSDEGMMFDAAGNVMFFQTILPSELVTHAGDTDTELRFTTDQIRLKAGNETLVDLYEGAQDYVKLGDGGDVDVNLNDMVFVRGSDGKVGVGTNSPSEKFHVTGTARFDSGITYIPEMGDISMGVYTNSP